MPHFLSNQVLVENDVGTCVRPISLRDDESLWLLCEVYPIQEERELALYDAITKYDG